MNAKRSKPIDDNSHDGKPPLPIFGIEVLKNIRVHARTSMSAEICGVLLGRFSDRHVHVEAMIPGEKADQGGSHVTFKQETWEHIHRVKDERYPDLGIVGWYHSHPGFGIFLSEYDLFIHKNFFPDHNQVAWVFDPHSDEEGCFGWIDDNIVRLPEFRVGQIDSPKKSVSALTEPLTEMADSAITKRKFWRQHWRAAAAIVLATFMVLAAVYLTRKHVADKADKGENERSVKQNQDHAR